MPWDEVMHKWKAGTLRSSSGEPVKSQAQAVAIMESEKRAAEGGKKEYQSPLHRLSYQRRRGKRNAGNA